MVKGGCAKVIVDSMGEHLFRKNVQMAGCAALNYLALEKENVVILHTQSTAVNKFKVECHVTTCDSTNVQAPMGQEFAHVAVVNAMNQHRQCEEIQYHG